MDPFPAPAEEIPAAGGADAAETGATAVAAEAARRMGGGVLRALFLSADEVTVESVVKHCAELPGIGGCLAISSAGQIKASAGGVVVAGDPASFCASARTMADSLGDRSSPFTVRAGAGHVSLFGVGESRLAVSHGDDAFAPGVSERLDLIAGELDSLPN